MLTDKKNRLTSQEGEYIPATKDANFYIDVHLKSLSEGDTLDIYTDSLFYNTNTHQANFTSPTKIINADGVINSTDGTYNTTSGEARLYRHSSVRTNSGTTLAGDTLKYDRQTGIGEAFGNMSITDSVKQSTLSGDYGYYNDIIDSAFVTGHAVAKEYSKGDTLYMHGRYITSVLRVDSIVSVPADSKPAPEATATSDSVPAAGLAADSLPASLPGSGALNGIDEIKPVVTLDSTHIISAWPRVRFYRSDMQGVCASMSYVEKDSCLYMHRHPIVWNEGQQVFGNLIIVHLNDSTVDRADLPDFAFVAQEIEPDIYNRQKNDRLLRGRSD